jgi:hypothetical protein
MYNVQLKMTPIAAKTFPTSESGFVEMAPVNA